MSESRTPRTDAILEIASIEDRYRPLLDLARQLERELAAAQEQIADNKDALASRLIDAWCADHDGKMPWAKAVQITAIVTKQPDDERDRLLHLGGDDGSCEMCGRNAIQLEEQIAVLKKDAERYRWWRKRWTGSEEDLDEINELSRDGVDTEDEWDELIDAAIAAQSRPCTCHPDDNPPVPCQRKYAITECRIAAQSGKT